MGATQEVIIPSHHQMGEDVIVDFGMSGKLKHCLVAGINFTNYGKVLYDLDVHLDSDGESESYTTIYSVDSVLVKKKS